MFPLQLRFSSACLSDVEGLFDREDDVFDLRQAVVLQDFGVRHGDVHACDSGDWSVKVVEGRTCVGVESERYGSCWFREQKRRFAVHPK